MRITGFVEFHHVYLQLGALEGGDRAQLVDPYAFPLGFVDLVLVNRHLVFGSAVDDDGVLAAQLAGNTGGVATPVYCDGRPRLGRDRKPPCAGVTPRPTATPRRLSGCSSRLAR